MQCYCSKWLFTAKSLWMFLQIHLHIYGLQCTPKIYSVDEYFLVWLSKYLGSCVWMKKAHKQKFEAFKGAIFVCHLQSVLSLFCRKHWTPKLITDNHPSFCHCSTNDGMSFDSRQLLRDVFISVNDIKRSSTKRDASLCPSFLWGISPALIPSNGGARTKT